MSQESNSKEKRTNREKQIYDYRVKTFGMRYADASMAKLSFPQEIFDKLKIFMSNPKNFLVFTSTVGTGKSYLCSAMVEWMFDNFRSFRFWREADLLERIRKSIDLYGDYMGELNHCIDDDFIILDDVGSTGITDWRKEVLFAIIDNRYNSMKPTIIISNFNKQEMKSMYHPRVIDRIFATENVIIDFQGESKREMGL